MEIWQAVILGIVQGLTEFLPVSSSGHLVLVQTALGVNGTAVVTFDVAVHLGTLVAVVLALKGKVADLVKHPLSVRARRLYLASIPAGIAGILLNDVVTTAFNARFIFLPFAVTAILLLVADYAFSSRSAGKEVDTRIAMTMGIGQALAIFPGLSRSGTTIAFGAVSGGNREDLADFSFLMSIPVILGAAILEAYKLVRGAGSFSAYVLPTLIGMVSAALSGYFAVKWMLKVVKNRTFKPFIIYLGCLSVITFVNYLVA